MGGERQRAEGALLSLPTANVCSWMSAGERHWMMAYIKIKLLPLLDQKEAWRGNCALYTWSFIINCILETQSSKDTLHSHGPQALHLAGYTNRDVDYLVFRGRNVIFFNVCKCNVIVWYYGRLLVTAIITHVFHIAPAKVIGKFPNDFNRSRFTNQTHFFLEGNKNILQGSATENDCSRQAKITVNVQK